jgi:hypothetical protein
MFVGAYWGQRKESKESAAERIAAFLEDLAGCGDAFATWYSKATSRAVALRSPMGRDAASLVRNLKPNRRDADRQPIPELGHSLSAWNGGNFSFSATIGSWNEQVGNAVVLNLGAERDLGQDSYQRIIEAAVRAFDPDHAVITSHEQINRAGATRPWEVGFFMYHRGGRIERHTIA